MNRLFLKNALQLACWRIGVDPTGDKPVTLTAKNPTTGDQVTRYVYGSSKA